MFDAVATSVQFNFAGFFFYAVIVIIFVRFLFRFFVCACIVSESDLKGGKMQRIANKHEHKPEIKLVCSCCAYVYS